MLSLGWLVLSLRTTLKAGESAYDNTPTIGAVDCTSYVDNQPDSKRRHYDDKRDQGFKAPHFISIFTMETSSVNDCSPKHC